MESHWTTLRVPPRLARRFQVAAYIPVSSQMLAQGFSVWIWEVRWGWGVEKWLDKEWWRLENKCNHKLCFVSILFLKDNHGAFCSFKYARRWIIRNCALLNPPQLWLEEIKTEYDVKQLKRVKTTSNNVFCRSFTSLCCSCHNVACECVSSISLCHFVCLHSHCFLFVVILCLLWLFCLSLELF